ncbi:hypothetical protein D3C86_1934790 [compost metagenome]
MVKLSMPLPWLTAPVTCPALMLKTSAPSPRLTMPTICPESMLMVSMPAPNVTLPLIVPVPLVGRFRVLLPARSLRGPPVPLSHKWVSLPAVGVKVHAAWAV